MRRSVMASLTEQELQLVRDTEPAVLQGLDEDELLDLHTRARRARSKHVKVYRRGASAAVAGTGARGASYARNQRARDKAEVFETVLARVSRHVAAAAKRSSEELRDERLARARDSRSAGPADGATDAGSVSVPNPRSRPTRTTGGLKRDASSRSQGARRQAARDSS